MTETPNEEFKKEVVLRVEEARNRDTGRKRVRIDIQTMRELGLRPGDIVEIEGKKKTVAIVWPGLPEDNGRNIIRMDGILRKSAGVNVGDKVIVRKAEVQPAVKIKLAPVSQSSVIDEGFKRYIKKRLLGIPVVER
ncbi:MAG: AAA family ATPase, partial [Crenarchaeota archaeon]|nr:AAA family ATPase [Thermoproteota archaeon]